MFLRIKAKPGAKQNQIQFLADGTLQIKIKAPAQDGRANDELIRFLSETIEIPRSKIKIVSGHIAPFKKIEIEAEEEFVKKKLSLL